MIASLAGRTGCKMLRDVHTRVWAVVMSFEPSTVATVAPSSEMSQWRWDIYLSSTLPCVFLKRNRYQQVQSPLPLSKGSGLEGGVMDQSWCSPYAQRLGVLISNMMDFVVNFSLEKWIRRITADIYWEFSVCQALPNCLEYISFNSYSNPISWGPWVSPIYRKRRGTETRSNLSNRLTAKSQSPGLTRQSWFLPTMQPTNPSASTRPTP